MPLYSYAIGLTSSTTNVESLTIPLNPPRGRWYEASVFNDRLDGGVSGHGSPYAVWHFDWLTLAMVYQLRQFVGTSYSAPIYIVTRIPPTAASNSEQFLKYSGIMVWPVEAIMNARNFNGNYLGLDFTFRKLVAV